MMGGVNTENVGCCDIIFPRLVWVTSLSWGVAPDLLLSDFSSLIVWSTLEQILSGKGFVLSEVNLRDKGGTD